MAGAQWRLPSLDGLWTLWGRKENSDHVPPSRALWQWGGEAKD